MSLLGQAAPDFSLLDIAREPVSLSGLRGKKVVLAFFPAAFSGVCEAELCAFRNNISRFNDVNAVVLAISVDSPFSNSAFATKNDLNFQVLSDFTRSAVNAYGIAVLDFAGMSGYVASNRAVFVVDEKGTVTYEWIAPNLGTEPDYEAVKAAVS